MKPVGAFLAYKLLLLTHFTDLMVIYFNRINPGMNAAEKRDNMKRFA